MIKGPQIALVAALATLAATAPAQQRPPISAESVISAPPYAEYADLVLAAPVIVDATIRSATRLKGPDAVGVPAGEARLYIEADVLALIRSAAPLPPRIAYVVDVPVDARGRLPKLRKARVLLFARPVAHDGSLIQLVRPDAQRNWAPATDALTRQITREVLATDAPPMITGVGNAFHVAGDLPGTGETQIFLSTDNGRPVSLNIKRRPGEAPHWSVALTDIVDEGAVPPARDTLLWYRLACSLPPALPDSSLATADADSARIAREDYGLVLQSLGTCNRGGAL